MLRVKVQTGLALPKIGRWVDSYKLMKKHHVLDFVIGTFCI